MASDDNASDLAPANSQLATASTLHPSETPSSEPVSQSFSPPARSTPSTGSHRPLQRFVMNKVEKAWVLVHLVAFGAPLQKMKTFDTTCGRVAEAAKSRHIADSAVVAEQNRYGMSWRMSHMLRITAENVRHVVNSVPELAKNVVITSLSGSLEVGGPVAAARGSE